MELDPKLEILFENREDILKFYHIIANMLILELLLIQDKIEVQNGINMLFNLGEMEKDLGMCH